MSFSQKMKTEVKRSITLTISKEAFAELLRKEYGCVIPADCVRDLWASSSPYGGDVRVRWELDLTETIEEVE